MAGRGGVRQAGVGRPRSGRAGVGRGVTGAALPWLGGAIRGATVAGRGWGGRLGDGDDACGSNVRERSGRKKRRGRVLYPLMFVGPTHQPTNISRLATR
jgi:hypothetical protein